MCRVDEFKQQLYFLNQNITSNSEKMKALHENTEQLLALFQKIDQMEVELYRFVLVLLCVSIVTRVFSVWVDISGGFSPPIQLGPYMGENFF